MLRSIATVLGLSSVVLVVSAQKPFVPLPEKVVDELHQAGFHTDDLGDLVVKDAYRSKNNGVQHIVYRQRWEGIEIWNADIALHTTSDGSVVRMNNGGYSGVAKRINTTAPSISAERALRDVLAKNVPGLRAPAQIASEDQGRRIVFDNSTLAGTDLVVQLVYQPVGEALRLAWNVNHYTPDGSHWWNVRVDAVTGVELDRNDWVAQCGFDDEHGHNCEDLPEATAAPAAPNDYNVLPWPVESPIHGSRALRNAPWNDGGVASPFGWHDTDGTAGPEYTDTRGNNVNAQEDADNNNTGGARPSGGATLDFDFPLDLTQAPATYLDAATTNLYYWNNLIHDVWHGYGFDDASGNFQQNNYGRGGAGNDPVSADAQDGSGTNNANFGTPPDGSAPRMQMYRWTYTTPNRDSDLDNGIIAHEYGHGISNRLVGGPANTSCLGNSEQMGEGWSDYFGLIMTIKAGDQGTDGRGVGTYVLGQPTTGVGIRPARYSTNFATNNYTYASTNNTSLAAPHGIGFVWCTMLWEMTWELIGIFGLDPDIYNGTGGNNIAMQLVIDGLKLTPCNPGFVDGRDAILLADQLNNGGANQEAIWAAFARRGLGVSANQGSSSSRTDQTETYDTPVPINVGVLGVLGPKGDVLDCAATNYPVSASIRNFGSLPQTGFDLHYQLDGGPLVTETFPGTLNAGASTTFIFTQPVTITGSGAHTLVISTDLTGDQVASDDQSTAAITISTPAVVLAPYIEDIEAASPTPNGWTLENPDNGTTWISKALSGQSTCVGAWAWAIDNYATNAPGQQDRLISPVLDLSSSAGSRLKFDHAYSGYSDSYVDQLLVDVSGDCGRTWTNVYNASGSALQTTPYVTSAWTPSDCTPWLAHDIDISAYDGGSLVVRFVAVNGYGNWLYLDNAEIESNGVRVALKLILEGAYNPNTDRMRDTLRFAGHIPLTEPYTALGFTHAGSGGGETIDASILSVSDVDNAVVDWVLLELRDSSTPTTLVATRSALVQRDGDVVDKDGVSAVTFLAGPGNYHVAVRHRNHLGAMTAAPVALSATAASVDFTSVATSTYGTEGRKATDGKMVLWAGNVLRDGVLRYVGDGNDRDPILFAIGGSVPTNVSPPGYLQGDVNMDSVLRYVGASNDRDPILENIGGSAPTTTRTEQLP